MWRQQDVSDDDVSDDDVSDDDASDDDVSDDDASDDDVSDDDVSSRHAGRAALQLERQPCCVSAAARGGERSLQLVVLCQYRVGRAV